MAYSTPGLLTDESRWLAKLVRMQRMAIHQVAQAGGNTYNTVENYNVAADESHTFDAGTVHSISFSVTQGSLTVSFDGGGTSAFYPAGTSLSIEAGTTFTGEIQLLMSNGVDDAAIVQIVTA